MKRRFGRFWATYGRDLAIAGIGAALGLVLVVVLTVQEPAPPPPVPEEKEAAAAPQAPQRATPGPPVPAAEGPAVSPPAAEQASLPPAASEHVPAIRPAVPQWQRNAVTYPPTGNRPMIALIIDDMGLDRKRSARAVALGGPLTLSYLTYAKDLPDQTAAARKAGHEVLVHVPMEPEGDANEPGPNVIAIEQSAEEVMRRLDWALGRFDGFVGINNHMGSRYTADEDGMTLVLNEVKRRGLLFVDSRTTPRSVARRLSRKLSVPFAERHVFVDDDPRPQVILRQLDEIVRHAREHKYAVAIGHPRDETLAALRKWLPTLRLRGLELVPVSAIVRHRMEAD